MKPYWFRAIALAVVLLLVGFGYADKTRLHWVAEDSPTPQPDRVVGVERHCQTNELGQTNLFSPQHPMAVSTCDAIWDDIAADPSLRATRYLEIIVHTQAGTIYRIQVPATTKVALNDEWPPK
jgi:hypothetical protein